MLKVSWCGWRKNILGVHLDTVENWKLKLKTEKHCSEIIFKCVNSTVGPICNKKVAEKWNLWVHKQYTMCTDWSKKVWKVKICGYCSLNSTWTVTAKLDFSNFFQLISAYHVLFTDPQISLFNNFFIKNGSHDTIYTFKNYFVIVFFSFQFQFSAVSKRTLEMFKFKFSDRSLSK